MSSWAVGLHAISHFTLEAIGYIREADVVFFHPNSGTTAAYIRELNLNAIDLYEYYGEGKVRSITYIQMARKLGSPRSGGRKTARLETAF